MYECVLFILYDVLLMSRSTVASSRKEGNCFVLASRLALVDVAMSRWRLLFFDHSSFFATGIFL